jgi:hypothetical protein
MYSANEVLFTWTMFTIRDPTGTYIDVILAEAFRGYIIFCTHQVSL